MPEENNESESQSKFQLTEVNNIELVLYEQMPVLHNPILKVCDIQNSDLITSSEKEVLLATLNNDKIRTLDTGIGSEPQKQLVAIFTKMIWESGVSDETFSSTERKIFIPIAIEEIKREYPNLTIEDVRIAFRMGVRKKYGKFYGINIATMVDWLDAYVETTKYEAMLRLPYIKPNAVGKPKELTDEEKLQFHNDWINKIFYYFDKYKLTKTYEFYDFNNKFYFYCKKLGLINLDESQQQVIWNKAVDELKSENHPKNGKSFGSRVDLKEIYDKLKRSDEADKKTQDLIIVRARKITIFYFFKRLIKENKSLREVVEEAENKLKIS